jgi:PAS domain S-box-containing protein
MMNVLHRLGDLLRSSAAQMISPFKNSDFLVKAIIDSIGDAVLVVGQDRRIVLANPASCRLFGYSREELHGQTPEMIYPDREAYEQAGSEPYASLRQGKGTLFELTFRRKDGSMFDGEALGAVLNDLQGSPMWYVAVIRDITERKRLESALRQSEQRYRDLVSVIEARHIVYTHDVKGNFTYLSPSVETILGYSREAFGTHFTEYMTDHPANADAIRRTELSIRGEQQPAYGVQLFHRNGERRWLEVVETPLRGPDGAVTAVHGIGRDITDHKRSEEMVFESEARFRKIFESAPIGMHMYELRPDGRLVFFCANPAADRILGVDNSAFIGNTIEEAFPPLQHTEIPERYREAAASGRSWRSDNVVYENGAIRGAYEVVAFQTSPGMMVAAFTDITDRKRKEEELHRLNADLREASEKVRTLKGLLPICSYCKRIRDDNGKWEEIEGYVKHRSQAEFTHGICPECMKKLFPSITDDKDPDDRSGT